MDRSRSRDWDSITRALSEMLAKGEAGDDMDFSGLEISNELGRNAIAYVLRKGGPAELLIKVLAYGLKKGDATAHTVRSLLAAKDVYRFSPLHHAAGFCPSTSVLEWLSSAHPASLTSRSLSGFTPEMLVKTYGDRHPGTHPSRVALICSATSLQMSRENQLAVALSANRIFLSKTKYEPFAREGKLARMEGDAHFVVSVLGYLARREMHGLVKEIVSYVGLEGVGGERGCTGWLGMPGFVRVLEMGRQKVRDTPRRHPVNAALRLTFCARQVFPRSWGGDGGVGCKCDGDNACSPLYATKFES